MNDEKILDEIRRLEKIVMQRKRVSSNTRDVGGKHSLPPNPDAATPKPPPTKRRRVIYSSDSTDNEREDDNDNVPKNGSRTVDDDIDSVLGEDPTITKEYGEDIHATLAVRWNNVLQKGLKKENRADLLKKHLPPANCSFISPPKLNDQIRAAVPENAVKRDFKLEQKQLQLGIGITCIGRAFDAALKVPDKSLRDLIIKHLGDAGQVLTDLHYLESITRRSLLNQNLNKNTKEAVKDLTRDKLLYGEGLSEKLKAVKACSISAADIKMKQPKPSTSRPKGEAKASTSSYNASDALNWRGSSRRFPNSAAGAGASRERRPAAVAAPRRQQTSQRPPAKRS